MASDTPDLKSFLEPHLCANTQTIVDGKKKPCVNPVHFTCAKCKLVQYCSKNCQTANWKIHKVVCKSKILLEPYKPRWQAEDREPAFMRTPSSPPGLTDLIRDQLGVVWGLFPAIDILNVEKNESTEDAMRRDFSLLFVTTVDLRSVVKSIVGLPEGYAGNLTVAMNDAGHVTARNAILLLVAIYFEPEEAVPIILHVWYSALFPRSIMDALQKVILPLILDVWNKIRDRPGNPIFAKNFRGWQSVQRLMPCDNMTAGATQAVRRKVTHADVDLMERTMYKLSPGRRAGNAIFRQTGILLPFGVSREEFTAPNPTLFGGMEYLLRPESDPLDGWFHTEYKGYKPAAKADAYGALFFYLRDLLLKFCKRVRSFSLAFQVYSALPEHLPQFLPKIKFDRIDAYRLCDREINGPKMILSLYSDLLKPKSENPYAALIMFFISVVNDERLRKRTQEEFPTEDFANHAIIAAKFFGDRRSRVSDEDRAKAQDGHIRNHPEAMFVADTIHRWEDFDKLFAAFEENVNSDTDTATPVSLSELAGRFGLRIKDKDKQTIVAPWPYRATENMTSEEFFDLAAESVQGDEHYVEVCRA